jgi:hypothetical protein
VFNSAIGHVPITPEPFTLSCDGNISGSLVIGSNAYHPISVPSLASAVTWLETNLWRITIVPSVVGDGYVTYTCDNTSDTMVASSVTFRYEVDLIGLGEKATPSIIIIAGDSSATPLDVSVIPILTPGYKPMAAADYSGNLYHMMTYEQYVKNDDDDDDEMMMMI